MHIKAINFPFNTSVVSKKQFDDHMKLYEGYVTMANKTDEVLKTKPEYQTASSSGDVYRGWKKTETYSISGVILHELYFQNLGNKKDIEGHKIHGEKEVLGQKIHGIFEKHFGGYDEWKECFTACAKSARGWCILEYEQRTETFRNILLDFHDVGQITMAYPVLVLDMYEHAYFLDYGADKAAYIKNFIECIPWRFVETRLSVLS